MSSDNGRMPILALAIILLTALPASADVSFVSNPLWLSASRVTEGQPVRISTAVMKTSDEDASGTVTFYANETIVGTADFSLPSSVGGVVVGVSWAPASGEYALSAKITKAQIAKQHGVETLNASHTSIASPQELLVLSDNDRDTIEDARDEDDDNDGVSDADEKKNGTDPLKAETKVEPKVAGASTTAMIDEVKGQAQRIGSTVFTHTENVRQKGAEYVDRKLTDALQNSDETATTTVAAGGIVEPKPFIDQLRELPKQFGSVKILALKGASFVLNNIYAFYFLILAIVLLFLRKIWKRHSLD